METTEENMTGGKHMRQAFPEEETSSSNTDTKLWDEKNILRFLALIFSIVAIVQTIIRFNPIYLTIQLLMLIFVIQICRRKWDNSIAMGVMVLILLNLIPGALLVADAVTNKETN